MRRNWPRVRSRQKLSQSNALRKFRANRGTDFVWPRPKEGHLAASRADPNFFGAGIKIKAHFLFDLRFGIAGGKHFDADFWGLRKTDPVPKSSHAGRGGPSHISALYSIGRGNWALAEDAPVGNQCPQQVSDLGLVTSMTRSGRRTHYDMTMPIRFDPPLDFRQSGIGQQFFPPPQVERGLRGLLR